MSYQVLARKWRPQFFKDMVGQEHVLRALINALDNQRLHHAYLFTGTRGVGKTTIARILAKCLNCEQGISSEPCGTCSSCVEISEGRFVDLIEVDAASRTKVEDTREILDNVQYAPTRGRFKVYLIDEVHMLSNSSFNALLKTLEEPPPHVKFLLATTDPQKLPATVLSRCLQFSLKNMTPERIVGYLKIILGKEDIPFEEPGLWLLGKAAEGSMRDALSLTDQSISFGEGKIVETDVASMLGTVDRGRVFQLAIALAEADAPQAMALIAQMAEHAVDFNNLLADLLGLIHRIAIAQAVPDAVDNSQGDKEQVMTLASAVSPAMVQLLYQVALTGKRDLPLAPDPRAGMEMTLLRMLNFAPIGAQVDNLPPATSNTGAPPAKKPELAQLKRQVTSQPKVMVSGELPVQAPSVPPQPEVTHLEQVSTASTQGVNSEEGIRPSNEPMSSVPEPVLGTQNVDNAVPIGNVGAPVGLQAAPVPAVAPPVNVVSAPPMPQEARNTVQVSQPVPMEHSVEVIESEPVLQPIVESVAQVVSSAQVSEPANQVDESLLEMSLSSQSWPIMFAALSLEGMLRNLVANTCLMQIQGNNVLFHSDAGHMRLFGENHQQKFNQILNSTLSKSYQVQVIEGPIQFETPAQRGQRLTAERLQQAVHSIESDVNVQALRQAFNAQVIMDSIRPLDA